MLCLPAVMGALAAYSCSGASERGRSAANMCRCLDLGNSTLGSIGKEALLQLLRHTPKLQLCVATMLREKPLGAKARKKAAQGINLQQVTCWTALCCRLKVHSGPNVSPR